MAPLSTLLRRPALAAWIVALAGLAASVTGARVLQHHAQQQAQLRFSQSSEAFAQGLSRLLDSYTDIAFGLRELFVVNPHLGRREFVQAVERLELGTRHPEIKNLAFTRYVPGPDKAAFEARVRADTSVDPQGYPQFAIRPPGERPSYFVADYLWPMAGNQSVHGLDISAQPVNLASMRYAQTSGQPVASGPFPLLQESSHPTGFVIRVPVFGASVQAGAAATPERFLGAVAVTLRVWDLMQRLRAQGRLQGLAVTLTDTGAAYGGASLGTELPLYQDPSDVNAAPEPGAQRELLVFGRRWRVDTAPTSPFLSVFERQLPLWMGLGGALFSLVAAVATSLFLRRGVAKTAAAPPQGSQGDLHA